jgi:hypothetical protein
LNKEQITLINDFNQTIDVWLTELDRYSFTRLCEKPSTETWSIGQIYMHLLNAAEYQMDQVRICTSTNENEWEEASAAAKTMFRNNEFPDLLIKGPSSNDLTPQPQSKEQLINGLLNLRNEINTTILNLLSSTYYKGKTKHPGLLYFNAIEWLQFAEMHFRHHRRQKKRIDVVVAPLK